MTMTGTTQAAQVPQATGQAAATGQAPAATTQTGQAPTATDQGQGQQTGQAPAAGQQATTILGPDGQPFDFDRNARLIENLRAEKAAAIEQSKAQQQLLQQLAGQAPAQQQTTQQGQGSQQGQGAGDQGGGTGAQVASTDSGAQALQQVQQLQQQLREQTLRTEFVTKATLAGLDAQAVDFAFNAVRQQLQVTEGGQVLNLADTIDGLQKQLPNLFAGAGGVTQQGGDGGAQGGQQTQGQQTTQTVTTQAQQPLANTNGGNGSQGTGGTAPVLSADEAMFAEAAGIQPERYAQLRDLPGSTRLPAQQATT